MHVFFVIPASQLTVSDHTANVTAAVDKVLLVVCYFFVSWEHILVVVCCKLVDVMHVSWHVDLLPI